MQIQNNFFYNHNFSDDIKKIAQSERKQVKEKCNSLLNCLKRYIKNSQENTEFIEKLKNIKFVQEKQFLKTNFDCREFIKALKNLPTNVDENRTNKERNLLKFIAVPDENPKVADSRPRSYNSNYMKYQRKDNIEKNINSKKLSYKARRQIYKRLSEIDLRAHKKIPPPSSTTIAGNTNLKSNLLPKNPRKRIKDFPDVPTKPTAPVGIKNTGPGTITLKKTENKKIYENLLQKNRKTTPVTQPRKPNIIKRIRRNKHVPNSKKTTSRMMTAISNKREGTPVDSATTQGSQRNSRGLPNIGFSCYLNSALQSLYADKKFRKMVMNFSEKGTTNLKKLAVKRIFAYLESGKGISYGEWNGLYSTLGHHKWNQQSATEWENNLRDMFGNVDANEKLRIVYGPGYGKLTEYIKKSIYNNLINTNPPDSVDIEVSRGASTVTKDNTDIDVPEMITYKDNTDINVPEMITYRGNKYDLTFVMIHYGNSLNSGHYYTYSKIGRMWKLIDDNNTKNKIWESIERDISTNCTFLRYEKQQ